MKVIIFILLVISCLFANSKEKIVWLVNDAPPFYILDGNLKNKGFGDMTQEMIIKNLPQYEHEIKKTNLKRAMKDFEYKKNVCFSTWIYNSTPQLVFTSKPNIYYPPLGIIITEKNMKKLAKDIVSLDELLKNKNFIFGQAKGRGYSKKLDDIIEKYKNQSNFIIRTSSNNATNGIFEMIKRGRIDYTVDYYSSLVYYELNKTHNNKLVFIPILETQNKGVLGSVACSKSQWGEKVISDINQSIDSVKNKSEYIDILNKWLVPASNEKEYWHNYETKVKSIK